MGEKLNIALVIIIVTVEGQLTQETLNLQFFIECLAIVIRVELNTFYQ